MAMPDFGMEYEKAKAQADLEVEGFKESIRRMEENNTIALREKMKPLETVVRPALQRAADQLKSKGVLLLIDHDEFYNMEGKQRLPALHFQIVASEELRSMVYTFRVDRHQIICDGDDGSKKPLDQRIGALAMSANSASEEAVGNVVSRAIIDITNTIRARGIEAAKPKTSAKA